MLGLFGVDPADFDGDYASTLDRIHPDDRAAVDATTEACLATGTQAVRYRVIRADNGELRWIDARGRALYDAGVAVRLVGAVADVTELVMAEREAREAQAFYNAVLVASPDLAIVTDLETGRVVYASREEGVLGLSDHQLTAMTREDRLALVHPDDHPHLEATDVAARGLRDGEVLELRYRGWHADETWHWVNRHVTPFRRDPDGTVVQVLGVVRDITDLVEAEERLTHAALHDPLTGLPNRALLLDRLTAALARSLRDGRRLSVLFCDLDGFKGVNDTFGHSSGDAVLLEVARRLLGVLREGDTVARVGGDEFIVLVEPWNRKLPDKTPGDADADRVLAMVVAGRISTALRRPFVIDEVEHALSANIGIAHTPASADDDRDDTLTADRILRDADAAMYRAKQLGKNRTEVLAVPAP